MNTNSSLSLQFLPISVVICTLNEEDNVGDCIDTIRGNNPSEIIVIDGGSNDNTVKIATGKKAHTIVCERRGLAYQRYVGVDIATQPYVAFIDADDRLDSTVLSAILDELIKNKWKAIGIPSDAFKPSSYWEKAMGFLDIAYHNIPGRTNMIGRPALYEKETLILVGIDKYWGIGIGNEDTDLSIRYEKLNIPMGIGTGKLLRKHPSTFNSCIKTWIKYGKGDAKISLLHPDKKKNMLSQVYRKYFGKMTGLALRKRQIKYIPFIWMMGITRFIVAVWYLTVFSERLALHKRLMVKAWK